RVPRRVRARPGARRRGFLGDAGGAGDRGGGVRHHLDRLSLVQRHRVRSGGGDRAALERGVAFADRPGREIMSAMQDELVKRFPSLAESLSTEELGHLVAALERRQVADGEVLLTDGLLSTAAYLLVDGALRIVLNAGGTGVDA